MVWVWQEVPATFDGELERQRHWRTLHTERGRTGQLDLEHGWRGEGVESAEEAKALVKGSERELTLDHVVVHQAGADRCEDFIHA